MRSKLIQCFLSALIFSSSANAQLDQIGRIKLELPEGRWVTQTLADSSIAYSGDVSGTLKADRVIKVLLDNNNAVLAVVQVSASSDSMTQGRMNWTSGCKQLRQEYSYDHTKGSLTSIDCLHVWPNVNPKVTMEIRDKAALADMTAKGFVLPNRMYQVTHMVGTETGNYVQLFALIANTKLKQVPASQPGGAYEGKPGVAWGHLYAETARNGVSSFRGNLKMPSLE